MLPKRKDKKKSKNYGPLFKLNLPDFKGINQHYENQLEQIGMAPPQAKPPTKLKPLKETEKPKRMGIGKKSSVKPEEGKDEKPKNEEEDLLLGKKHEENPWIQGIMSKEKKMGATLPKPKIVLREGRVYGKDGSTLPVTQKDEGLQLLAQEYEMFNDPNMPSTRSLGRFDCWDNDRAPEEWVHECKQHPDREWDAMSPVYENNKYTWKKVKVLDYDAKTKKYRVKVLCTGQIKSVNRLSLLFYAEDKSLFVERLRLCKERQEIVQSELRFTSYIDSLSKESVSEFRKEYRNKIVKYIFGDTDNENKPQKNYYPDNYLNKFRYLFKIVEEEYIRQMKKCLLLKDMQDVSSHMKYEKFRIPIRLPPKTTPYLAVHFKVDKEMMMRERLANFHRSSGWMEDDSLLTVMNIFTAKCEDFQQNRFIQTKKDQMSLPLSLKDLTAVQKAYFEMINKSIENHWREYLYQQMQERLQETYDFVNGNYDYTDKSPLKKIIRRFDFMFNTYVRNFVSNSIQEWVKFIQSFSIPKQNELWDVSASPLMEISLEYIKSRRRKNEKEDKKDGKRDKKIAVPNATIDFHPSLDKCKNYIMSIFDQIIESTNNISILETNDLLIFMDNKRSPSFPISNENPWIQKARESVQAILDEAVIPLQELLQKFKKYEYILGIKPKALIQSLFKTQKASIQELRDQLESLAKAKYEVETLANNEVNFPMFRVLTESLKTKISNMAKNIMEEILKQIAEYCQDTVNDINNTYDTMAENISRKPMNETELDALKKHLRETDKNLEEQKDRLNNVADHLDLIEEFYMTKYDKLEHVKFFEMMIWPIKIKEKKSEGNHYKESTEDAFRQRLQVEKERFLEDLQRIEAAFEVAKTFDDALSATHNAIEVHRLENEIVKAGDKIVEFNQREELLGIKKTEYVEFDHLKSDFKPFHRLWSLADDIENGLRDYTTNRFLSLEAEIITKNIDNWLQECRQLFKILNERFEGPAKVVNELSTKILDFKINLPLVTALRSDAIKADDWNELASLINPGLASYDEITLQHMVNMGLLDHMDEIEEITTKAEKKYSLEKQLESMKKEWNDKFLTIVDYKDTSMIKGYEDIQANVDDQISNTQSMLGNQFCMGDLKKRAKDWEQKLFLLSDILEQIQKCQRTWLYLEPIFSSEDIIKKMAKEKKIFDEVDTLWKETMEYCSANSAVLDLTDKEGIRESFEKANKNLDNIQRQLSDYLESKRKDFPRFYFLSNDDLLLILSQTKNPYLVQPHMSKCFEGISRIVFSETQCVQAMISAEDEHVQFTREIDVNEGDKKGNVEKWLGEVESVMIGTLKEITKKALQDYNQTDRTKWVLKWPGQIVLTVNQIEWTTGVDDAIRNAERSGLNKYIDLLNAQLKNIVDLVRGELSEQERLTLGALVVIDVHARDVVNHLVQKGVKESNDFDWIAQLRYYYEKGDILQVKMVNAVLLYGYEYIGNSPRLVITPLTDRCYRTLMGAKHLNYGGAPEGPAGTGKTETVKDLAKALAVQCVVFNCSDGLDYKAMGKFFKGLASSGAWCCFDEFNRIELEVLSVIASQILIIQQAIQRRSMVFSFLEDEIKLNPQCAINITMNPGYAGRSELPDNLKALLRPCAMMVPDYSLIAEIMLYSFGFQDARNLARKVVASLRLSSEQLSSQGHYDFGMRALKAILTAAGSLIHKMTESEEIIVKRALNDVNIPKFTQNDIPLFEGITSDLFPGIKMPTPDYGILEKALIEAAEARNLQPKPEFISKCIQLLETIQVRHGLMLVGAAFSGKSSVVHNLADAFGMLREEVPEFEKVIIHKINPKAVNQQQLYGEFDIDTHEWTDGVLAIKIRTCAESETDDKKWIVFDGPVDAVWIENMNTVLDDNKKLCLSSGQIIKLKPTMTMMFEVEDLAYASPATVSRCGMVFLETSQLGWEVLVKSYVTKLPGCFGEKREKFITDFFFWSITPTLNFLTRNCKFPLPQDSLYLVNSFINLFESFIAECRAEDYKPPNDLDTSIINHLVFSLVWSMGGAIIEEYRGRFHDYIGDLLSMVNVKQKYYLDEDIEFTPQKHPVKFEESMKVFEQMYQKKQNKWINWIKYVPPFVASRQQAFHELIIPTIDSIRVSYLFNTLAKNKKHVLFVGPTGTGKTIAVNAELKNSFQNEEFTFISLGFSAQTSANDTQRIIDGRLEKRKRQVYGPSLKRKGIIFVDDLNMPQKEKYGAQPPIELLRQWMDNEGWYDIDTAEKEFRRITDITFAAAMGPPNGGRNPITNRYVRHFNMIYVEPYDASSLNHIYSNIINWFFLINSATPFPKNLQQMGDSMVSSTIDTYQTVQKDLRPTPSKSHYLYNLRDVSKVFQGISKASPKAIKTENDFIKLWGHECCRVFQDRLISTDDRDKFLDILKTMMKKHFKKDWEKVVLVEPLLFGNFVPMIYPDDDRTKKPLLELYCELSDRDLLKSKTEDFLSEYNTFHSTPMDIVLFMSAIEHIVKITRIITLPLGHCLLVGVGGSGRKSLTILATFIVNYDTFQIELNNKYDIEKWHEDMRSLVMKTGVDFKGSVFLLSDTQIAKEQFLEDVNNILNTGEIPNLFSKNEDIQKLLEYARDVPAFSKIGEAEQFEKIKEYSKSNLHVSICMSPIGEDFRRRLRMFPSLVNCTTIDWFLPWPEEALRSVADYFLADQELEKREGIISICVDMQERVRRLSIDFRTKLRRYYYVTPTSYLELIKMFKILLNEKIKENTNMINRYTKGLEQLFNTEQVVKQKEEEIIILKPQLEKSTEETKLLLETLIKEQAIVNEKTKIVEKEEDECKEKSRIAKEIEDRCEGELAKAMPMLNQALEDVKKLKNSHVVEMCSFPNPPEAVKSVVKTLSLFFKVKPIKPSALAKDKEPEYWAPAKKAILNSGLKKKCLEYDKDHIEPSIIAEVVQEINKPTYENKVIENASIAAFGFAKWVRAMVKYDEVAKIVAPMKADLEEAKHQSKLANDQWETKKKELEEQQEKMRELKAKHEEANNNKERLEREVEDCKQKLSNAKELTEKLADEKLRWSFSNEELKKKQKYVVGDVILSSGIIAYLGVFNYDYRKICIESWSKMLEDYGIAISVKPEDYSTFLKITCGDEVKIRNWQQQTLPSDPVSVENAIILEKSSRWPLLIDPQIQANPWIKKMEMPNIKILKCTQDTSLWIRTLRQTMPLGYAVILEDIGETIDPILDPLLRKAKQKQGSLYIIKVGDELIQYDIDFKFYLSTKLPRPHYSPEVCVSVTMLNFTVTETGLFDQMLDIIMENRMPAQYKKRSQNILQSAKNKYDQKKLEDMILNMIASVSGNILDDKELIERLKDSKTKSAQIEATLKEQEKVLKNIEKSSEYYKPMAKRSSNLFFCISDLSYIEPMYQYSLKWYKDIFKQALNTEDSSSKDTSNKDKELENKNFLNLFTYLLYQNICKSLFEKDKLLFSFLLCMKILETESANLFPKDKEKDGGRITSQEIRFLMTGASSMTLLKENPTKKGKEESEETWLTNAAWNNIVEMARDIPIYKDLDTEFEKNLEQWKAVYDTPELHDISRHPWPNGWADRLNSFQRLAVINALRPDKIIPAIQALVTEYMGQKFIEPPTFNLEESYKDSKNITPIIFVLSPGADPLLELKSLAEKLGLLSKYKPMSLGQGQGSIAKKEIDVGKEIGSWVVLQNCHLASSFMPELERITEALEKDKVDDGFRLWLTSMPSDDFPVSILQNGIKLTNEPPKGLKSNLLRSYFSFDEKFFESCDKKPQAFKKLLFGLSFFNALILERRSYGPLGWNIPYEFSQSDLKISLSQLHMFLQEYDDIPWEALNYMVAEANYGGRVTDPQDRRAIKIILSEFYCEDILKPGYKFSILKDYYAPEEGPLSSYIEYIKNLPMNDHPEVFGLHENADITSAINNTSHLLGTALSLLPRNVSGGGQTKESILEEKAKMIAERIPEEFNLEATAKKHPIKYEESMNTVLQQELIRYNNLIRTVKNSLAALQKAIKGEVIMSVEIEAVGNSLFDNMVPEMWNKVSYPCLKPLSSWINDFLARLKFMQDWIDNYAPPVFWFSGFFFTQSFITGTLQNYARKTKIAIDTLVFDFYVVSDPKEYDLSNPPEDGCYISGLFLEGARWSNEDRVLSESHPKILYTQVPIMWLKPIPQDKQREDRHVYECPVYKTSKRHGTLSTTGHSTNFVLMIELQMSKKDTMTHWVKRGVALLTQLND